MDPTTSQETRRTAVQGRRGYACAFCRRRKFVSTLVCYRYRSDRRHQKCDGRSPCRSCVKGKQTCSYDNTSHRTPTQLLQDRIDELQSKIASIESRKKTPKSSPSISNPPSIHSQNHYSIGGGYTEGPYVFSNEYQAAGPSRSLFASSSTAPYVADYVASECTSSSSSSYNLAFGLDGNYMAGPSSTSRSSPLPTWDAPAFEMSSPQLQSQSPYSLGRDGSIPAPLADKILFHFLTHRFRCGLLPLDRLQPQNLNTQRHPALLSASYLLGCFFCPDGSLAGLEPPFVERTRRALEDAVDITQDPSFAIDYLLASSMLALYLYCKGRLLEGYHRAVSAVRFAVNQGFHTIKALSRDPISMQDPSHALAVINERDRVCSWWFTFFIDRWGSLLTGLPCGIADADIQTPWPQTFENIIDHVHTNSVSSLYSPSPQIPDRVSSPYYPLGLKAIALLDRASVKASIAHTMPPEAWATEHAIIQAAIVRFAEMLDGVQEASNVEDGTTLSIVHIDVYAATCALHMPYIRQWAHDESRTAQRNHLRSICREAASTAAAVLRNLCELKAAVIPVWQGLPLAGLCEYLLQERENLIDELDFAGQAEVDKQLDEMMSWMHEMRNTFPLLGMQADKLEAKRR
ncbi:hypothetical protein CTheo_2348 [Ceratobasidium theobromae]|uniref:Xylanolytic transcriptional activator regulatory domain-containing protein n=1 Tax=Ceratobasidium theobromae TaxID=1582974 RepID=A0A5N5QSQ9_9AGAM|nr:hypothetical protein CTheo_2348 [Ceratobasidium theobromae]